MLKKQKQNISIFYFISSKYLPLIYLLALLLLPYLSLLVVDITGYKVTRQAAL